MSKNTSTTPDIEHFLPMIHCFIFPLLCAAWHRTRMLHKGPRSNRSWSDIALRLWNLLIAYDKRPSILESKNSEKGFENTFYCTLCPMTGHNSTFARHATTDMIDSQCLNITPRREIVKQRKKLSCARKILQKSACIEAENGLWTDWKGQSRISWSIASNIIHISLLFCTST